MTTNRLAPPIVGRTSYSREIGIAAASLTNEGRAERAAILAKLADDRAADAAADADRKRVACPCCSGRGVVRPPDFDAVADAMVEVAKTTYLARHPEADLSLLSFTRPAPRPV